MLIISFLRAHFTIRSCCAASSQKFNDKSEFKIITACIVSAFGSIRNIKVNSNCTMFDADVATANGRGPYQKTFLVNTISVFIIFIVVVEFLRSFS